MQALFTPEQIFEFALEGCIDTSRLDAIEKTRDLTPRETIEQGIAATKVIIFGTATLAMVIERLFTRR
jgi:hypothetical protein